MNHIKYLEFQKLMKELQFVESDYIYQSEVMKVLDIDFFKSVNNILENFPDLKDIYFKKESNSSFSYKEVTLEDISLIKNESPEVKNLYHSIVKTTHPDKVKNHKLNELYLEATEAYEQNDIITIYKVCSELSLEFELPDNYLLEIRDKINLYKNKIKFLENTFTFKWFNSDNTNEKNRIIIDFIKNKIN